MSIQKKTQVPGVQASTMPDDIEDIMNEIEELNQEMSEPVMTTPTPVKAVASAKPAIQDEPLIEKLETLEDDGILMQGGGGESYLEETLAEMKAETSGPSLLDTPTDSADSNGEDEAAPMEDCEEEELTAPVTSIKPVRAAPTTPKENAIMAKDYSDNKNDGSLTMTLKGNMTLRLCYEFEGQEVTIGFSEQCLKVELADGTEFRVPIHKSGAAKKAA